MIKKTLAVVLLVISTQVDAGSFRCGTRIVKTGDSISRLVDACGKPALKYKVKESIRSGGSRKTTGVTNWIYPRERKKNREHTIHSDKAVKNATD